MIDNCVLSVREREREKEIERERKRERERESEERNILGSHMSILRMALSKHQYYRQLSLLIGPNWKSLVYTVQRKFTAYSFIQGSVCISKKKIS